MANKKISELTSRTPALSDLMIVGDPSSGYSYKCTVTALATIIETDIADGFVTIGTTQTISGAKTFSNNLTLTSVANATTTQTKFLTLNSNVVNYRTGAEVLADIGGASASSISGTTNYVAKFTSSSAIGNSAIYSNTSGNVSIGNTNDAYKLDVSGTVRSTSNFVVNNGTVVGNYAIETAQVQIGTFSNHPFVLTTFNTERVRIDTSGNVTFSQIANATIDTDRFLVSDSGVIKYRTGAELLSDIGGQGTISLAAIGSTPNANGATLSSNTLTLQPASASFGGVLTTGFQEIAGWKRFTGNPIQFDNHLEIKNLNSWGVSWGYTSFASKDTPVFGFLRGHSSTGSVTYNAWFTYGTTGDRNYTLPSSDGTLALTSDITGAISGTTNYIPKFTSSSAIGNSIMQESGSVIDIAGSLRLSATGYLGFGGGTNYIEGDNPNNILKFATNNTERMRLDASGNLGINTSSPTYKLDVNGTGRFISNANGLTLSASTGTSNTQYKVNNTLGDNYFGVAANDGSSLFTGTTAYAGYVGTNNAYPLQFATGGSVRATLDASGNLGLGVTPSAWQTFKAIQINGGNSFVGAANQAEIWSNSYFDGGFKYYGTGLATRFASIDGKYEWYQAPSGTAGNAISFTQAMTLDASGRLGIGTSSPGSLLDVVTSTAYDGVIRVRSTGTNTPVVAMGVDAVASPDGYVGTQNNVPFGIRTNDVNRIWVTTSGNVGIGTTSPNSLASTTNLIVRGVVSSSTALIQSLSADAGCSVALYSGASSSDDPAILFQKNLRFGSVTDVGLGGFTERMRITSGGEVLINTTSDAGDYKLQVNGNAYIGSGGTFALASGDIQFLSNAGYGILSANSNRIISITNGAVEIGGTIKTAAPSGGTAKPWKLGEAGVTLGGSNTSGVRVEIDGVVYYLVTGYLP